MPQGVVDILEVIEVQAQKSEPLPTTELLQAFGDFLVEQMTVWQTSETIMHGQIRNLGLRLPALGNIFVGRHPAAARHGVVRDLYFASRSRLDDPVHDLALRQLGQKSCRVPLGIIFQVTYRGPVLKELEQ